jgi:hypothetical protein
MYSGDLIYSGWINLTNCGVCGSEGRDFELKWAAGRTYFMRNGMTFAVNVMQ